MAAAFIEPGIFRFNTPEEAIAHWESLTGAAIPPDGGENSSPTTRGVWLTVQDGRMQFIAVGRAPWVSVSVPQAVFEGASPVSGPGIYDP